MSKLNDISIEVSEYKVYISTPVHGVSMRMKYIEDSSIFKMDDKLIISYTDDSDESKSVEFRHVKQDVTQFFRILNDKKRWFDDSKKRKFTDEWSRNKKKKLDDNRIIIEEEMPKDGTIKKFYKYTAPKPTETPDKKDVKEPETTKPKIVLMK